MWDRILATPGLGFYVGDKASREEIMHVEKVLGAALPRSLHGFLEEMDGVAVNLNGLEMPEGESHVVKLVWSCKETIKQNRALRAGDLAPNRHMTYGDLLWFGRRPKGGLVGFQVTGGKVTDSTVFVVDPSQFSEPRPQAASLREYLAGTLAEYRRDHPGSIFDFI